MSVPDPVGGAIVSTTTLNDRLPNVQRFVDRLLAQGVDHMVVFIDDKRPAVRRFLDDHPRVTAVSTHNDWWHGARPRRVADRLRINANIANVLTSALPSVRWLIHLDCDEGVQIDRAELLALSHDAVRFPTLETVAALDSVDPPTRFKRPAPQPELALLTELGIIGNADPRAYFRGHWVGKVALRPGLTRRLRVHDVCDLDGNDLSLPVPDEMHLLHYESWCLEDFVSRWREYSPAQLSARTHRDSRKQLGLAAYAVLNSDALEDADRNDMLVRLYQRRVADDVDTLAALGLLVDVPAATVESDGLCDEDVAALEDLAAAVRPEEKHPFNTDPAPGDIRGAVAAVAERVSDAHPLHAERLRAGVDALPGTIGGGSAAEPDDLSASRSEPEAVPERPR